jgi:hypothetical protein
LIIRVSTTPSSRRLRWSTTTTGVGGLN